MDVAIRLTALGRAELDLPKLTGFVPFDPMTKMSEASALSADGAECRIVKGAFGSPGLAQPAADAPPWPMNWKQRDIGYWLSRPARKKRFAWPDLLR